MEKVFDLPRRMTTFATNEKNWTPAWKQKQQESVKRQIEDVTTIKPLVNTKSLF